MHQHELAQRMARLRELRGRRWSARTIGGDVVRFADAVKKTADQKDRKLEAWVTVVPDSLRRGVRVDSGGGVLTAKAPSASVRFALDRWLRGGGTDKLRAAGIGRVRLR